MPEQRIYVPVADADRTKIGELQKKLQGMSEASVSKILLHYGVQHADEAFAEAIRE